MANDIQIKMRIDTVKERMVDLINEMMTLHRNGVFKSEAELQNKVFHALQQFYDSVGRETFRQIKAWGPPYSSDHNGMMEQILYDLTNLYEESIRMTSDVERNFEQAEIERQAFLKRISEIEAIAKSIESNLNQDTDIQVFREDFTDIERYDQDATNGIRAYFSSNERLLTLHRVISQDLNRFAKVTVIKGDGLPGNTHIAHSVDGAIKFEGENELHINMASMIDQNSDTWYEYELFQTAAHVQEWTEGKDFRYKEVVEWVKNDLRSMRCVIQITFDEPKTMNWLSFMPYVPSDKGALPCRIEKVVVNDGKGNMRGMGFEEEFDTSKAFIFPQQECKEITLYLRQDVAYPTDVGHFYFKQIDSITTTVGDEPHTHDGVRVHGDIPSIEHLGVSYDTGKGEILYPAVSIDGKIENEAEKRQALFTPSSLSATGETVMSGIELVPALRYMVGIRDIMLSDHVFEIQSLYISAPFSIGREIKEISLEHKHDIPGVFGEGDWIQYHISVDDGRNWHPIHSADTYRENSKIRYIFNSNVPKEGRLEEYGYLDTENPVEAVRMRIILSRPGEAAFMSYTPVVHEYQLNALVE